CARDVRRARNDREAELTRRMGSETGDRERDARSRVCARKRSVAAGADRAAYARWSRYGKPLPAARAKPLWARVAGGDGARFGKGGIGEMAEESGRRTRRHGK